MNLKPDVKTTNVKPEIWYAIGVAATLQRIIIGGDTTVTSLNDSTHKTGSRHYTGRAADLRTKGLTPGLKSAWLFAMREHLEPFGFDVLDETSHFHVQYKPTTTRYLYVHTN